MFLTNLYASWRYLKQNPLFTLINVAGLVIGITSALFIFIYVSAERSYDQFHRDAKDIYRVIGADKLGEGTSKVGIAMAALGPAMEKDIPGVLRAVRIRDETIGSSALIQSGERRFEINHLLFTDDAFFDVFNFALLDRRSGPLLDRPHSAVITQAFAAKVFGSEPALGKTLRYDGVEVEVVGVMQDNRPDSHMQFELLLSFDSLRRDRGTVEEYLARWNGIDMVTYVKLSPDADRQEIERAATAMATEHDQKNFSLLLQSLQDAHLDSRGFVFDDFNLNKGDREEVMMLAGIAIFMLFIAGFNFMNLSTARSALRGKEVGIRKVNGATRLQLIQQYLQESLLLVLTAAVAAVLLLSQLAPLVTLPLAKGYVNYFLAHGEVIMGTLLALVLLGVISGSYPAFVLSSFSPVRVLRGKFANSSHGVWLRRLLVVVQFTLSITIIVGMLVVYRQVQFMKNADSGFVANGIVNLRLDDEVVAGNYNVLRDRLLQLPQVISVAGSSAMPGKNLWKSRMIKRFDIEGAEAVMVNGLEIDEDYVDTLGMTLVAGHSFSAATPADAEESIIVNESGARALGWGSAEAVGKSVQFGPAGRRTVIGVVKDFHFTGMRQRIEPVLMLYPLNVDVVSIRIDSKALREALTGIEAAWKEINPNYPFSYTLFEDEYNKLVAADEKFSAMLLQFAFIAIIIACLGLYGLASFNAEQKAKEIGMRKVLGAGTVTLLKIALREYAVLLLVANVLAWGVAWVLMQQWLTGFAYRAELSASSFVTATVVTATLALLSVAREVFKVVRARPVLSLRYE